jgi:predicted metalloendopeptidase
MAYNRPNFNFTLTGWTETASGKFSPISQCLINQYNKFKVNEINNMQINVELTLDENFPDTAGLFAAYKTFKTFSTPKTTTSLPGMEHFSQDQLFFIGFANVRMHIKSIIITAPLLCGLYIPLYIMTLIEKINLFDNDSSL